jgi:C-5 cytosine-specific DNA methylase
MELVLSLFPGLDLLGMAFAEAGFCVVRGPDPVYASRIEDFHARLEPGTVTGIIAGPPCQDFSKARRAKPSGHGLRMLGELLRVVDESRPQWVLVENVPQVPDVMHPLYSHQRLDIADCECGGTQLRRRHIQFLSLLGDIIRPERRFRRQSSPRRPLRRHTPTPRSAAAKDLPGPSRWPAGHARPRSGRWAMACRWRSVGHWPQRCHGGFLRTAERARPTAFASAGGW